MSKHDNFLRLSSARLEKVVKGIQSIGKLSNKSNYTYTPNEAEMLIRTLQYELEVISKLYDVEVIEHQSAFVYGEPPTRSSEYTPAITSYDKEEIKRAYLMMFNKDHLSTANGIKALRKVILGWKVETNEDD